MRYSIDPNGNNTRLFRYLVAQEVACTLDDEGKRVLAQLRAEGYPDES